MIERANSAIKTFSSHTLSQFCFSPACNCEKKNKMKSQKYCQRVSKYICTCNTCNYTHVWQQTRRCLPHIAALHLPHCFQYLWHVHFTYVACFLRVLGIIIIFCLVNALPFITALLSFGATASVLRLNAAEILIKLKMNIAFVSVVYLLYKYISIHWCVASCCKHAVLYAGMLHGRRQR